MIESHPSGTRHGTRSGRLSALVQRLDRLNRSFAVGAPDAARTRLIRTLLLASVALIGLPAMTQVAAVAGFVVGQPVGPATLPTAWILTAAGVLALARRTGLARPWRATAGLVVLQASVLAVGVGILGPTYDLSFDGQWFHQEAVLLLDTGWNPLRGPAPPGEATDIGARSRVDGYTKGPWIAEASLVSVTGRIEDGKAVDALLLAAAIAAAAAASLCFRGISPAAAAVIGILAAANPTALNQLSTHMVDGDLACALVVLISGLVVMTVGPAPGLASVAAALGLIWAVGAKFSGGPMVAALLTGAFVVALMVDRHRISFRVVGALVAALVVAALLNANPFVTNPLWFGHPLYPYYGQQRTDASFSGGEGGVGAMVVSMISRPARVESLERSHQEMMTGKFLIPPFRPSWRDFAAMRMPGGHIGGWGPLFGGMLALGLAIVAVEFRRRRPATAAVLLCGAVIVVSASVIQFPWVARYAPQTWLLPLLALPLALSSPRKPVRALGLILGLTAALNSGITTALHLRHAYESTKMVRSRLVALGADGEPFEVSYGHLRCNRRRLAELDLAAIEVSDPARSIEVVLDRHRARLKRRLIRSSGSGRGQHLVVRWRRDPKATYHRVRLTAAECGEPVGVPVVVDEPSPSTRAVFQVSAGRWLVELRACNSLGCGPADTVEITVPAGGSGDRGIR